MPTWLLLIALLCLMLHIVVGLLVAALLQRRNWFADEWDALIFAAVWPLPVAALVGYEVYLWVRMRRRP